MDDDPLARLVPASVSVREYIAAHVEDAEDRTNWTGLRALLNGSQSS